MENLSNHSEVSEETTNCTFLKIATNFANTLFPLACSPIKTVTLRKSRYASRIGPKFLTVSVSFDIVAGSEQTKIRFPEWKHAHRLRNLGGFVNGPHHKIEYSTFSFTGTYSTAVPPEFSTVAFSPLGSRM